MLFQRSATGACTAIPPPNAILSSLKSTPAKAGAFRSALKSVLTALKNVKGYLFISAMSVGISRGLTMSMFRHPKQRNRRQFVVRAKI